MALAMSLQGQAARAIMLHGPGKPTFVASHTINEYLDLIQGVFQPLAETQLSRMDFETRGQQAEEPISDYLSDKLALYYSAEPVFANRNFTYLRSHILKGIYAKWIQTQVILANPLTEDALTEACMTAVGQAREAYHLGTGVVGSLDGIASTTFTSRHLLGNTAGGVEPMEIGAVGGGPETRTCYKCQTKGHLAKECKKSGKAATGGKNTSDIVCHYCDRKGHKRPECRKMKKDKAEGKTPEKKVHPPKTQGGRVKKTTNEDSDPESEEEFGAGGINAVYQAFSHPDFPKRAGKKSRARQY